MATIRDNALHFRTPQRYYLTHGIRRASPAPQQRANVDTCSPKVPRSPRLIVFWRIGRHGGFSSKKIRIMAFYGANFSACVLVGPPRPTFLVSHFMCESCFWRACISAYELRLGRVTIRRNHLEKLGFRGIPGVALLRVSTN